MRPPTETDPLHSRGSAFLEGLYKNIDIHIHIYVKVNEFQYQFDSALEDVATQP